MKDGQDKAKLYMAGIMSGDYDEVWSRELFVTKNKETAQTWYDRFNAIRLRAWNLYSTNTDIIHGDWDDNETLLTRWFQSQHRKWAHVHPFIQDIQER